VLGVGFVSGTLIFTDTLSKTFNDLFSATAADVTVEAAEAFDVDITQGSGARATVPASVADSLREVDGVAAVQGFVEARACTSCRRTARCWPPAARRASASAGTRCSR
jgi:putative ABC transport system permease protein